MIYTEQNRRGSLTYGKLHPMTGPHPCPRCHVEIVPSGPRNEICRVCREDPARLAAAKVRAKRYRMTYARRLKERAAKANHAGGEK